MRMSELPQELLEEILCRVPATSLKRLRTTCKEWNRLFNDKKFSKKHFDKATKECLALTLTEESRACLLNVNLHNGTPSAELTRELSLIDSHSKSNQVKINKVSHCDGLLLCTIKNQARIVVWNPCTGQTKWIQTGRNRRNETSYDFVLGYSQDKKSSNKSYKILSYKMYKCADQEFEIYDFNSNAWMNIDVTPIPDYHISFYWYPVSLKGKTYWLAFDDKKRKYGLISFDYTRERFEPFCLPYQCGGYEVLYLSVVKEEKVSVLIQRRNTTRREIWVTNKIDDETKEMSWSKLLEVEVSSRYNSWLSSFFVDEEKKIVVCCEKYTFNDHFVISIIGEDKKAKQVVIRVKSTRPYESVLGSYVPSLIQIKQLRGKGKRKRRE